MAKKTIADINVKGKKVFMRVDFNVPLDDNGNITSDKRIIAALPSIKKVLEDGGSLILASHLGRPEGKPDPKASMKPVAKRLSELLGREVIFAKDCIGPDVKAKAKTLKPGDVLLLENVRFHKEEEIKDKKAKEDPEMRKAKDAFAKQMAELADVYVNDAFGTAHRDNASMYTVPAMMKGKPRVIGYLVEKELKFLGDTVANPVRPFVAILGGAKVSDKIGVIENLITKVNRILIGGAMAYTFFKANGKSVGNSLCEDDFLAKAKELQEKAKAAKCELLLPVDTVVAKEFKTGAENKVVTGDIDASWQGMDIGPTTRKLFADKIKDAKTIVWNGPMGVFEMPPFDEGTKAVAQAVADATGKGARSVIGGGDSASALKKLGLDKKVTHISTGGGASLEFLEGKKFVCLEILDKNKIRRRCCEKAVARKRMAKPKLPKAGIIEVNPSILSADFSRLADELAVIEKAGVKMVHLDIMDGHFVPNITIGPPVVAKLRKHSKLFFDCHLMITDPRKYATAFVEAGANNLTFHIEVEKKPAELIKILHDMGVTASICLNPETPVKTIEKVAPLCDMVLVMTVHPGFGGQKFITTAAKKIRIVRKIVGPNVRVEVDGGIDVSTTPIVVGYGADTLVAGHAIFSKKDRIAAINTLRKACK